MTETLSDPYTGLNRCPQCGAAKPTLTLEHIAYKAKHLAQSAPAWGWAIYQCTSCKDIICFEGIFQYYTDFSAGRLALNGAPPVAVLKMPPPGDQFTDWPARARNYMLQATESLSVPDGAVMLIGSAVDAMLKALGLTDGSVHSRINAAVASHLLTVEMGEWAHAVRLSSNAPRHADDEDPHATREEAQAVIEFAKALGQFLFVLPARIREGKQAAEKAGPGGAKSVQNPL